MFTTSDLSLNQYHHVFFQVAPATPHILTTHMYDNAMNSLGTIDTSFGTQSIVDVLTSFDQSGANPYAVGVDHAGSTKVNMDLAFLGVYNSVLKDKQHQSLMKFTNQTLLEPHSQATIHLVTVTAGKFYVNGVQQPYLLQNPGYYVFDQRHASNATHPLLLSTTEHGTHGGGTEYTTGVVKNGTPGSLNAYTLIQVNENTPDLFYYCANHTNMGGAFSNIDLVYYVKVVQNFLGEYVYAISTTANGTFYNQMDLSFNAGQQYLFNVGDSSNTGYRLEFGSTVDDVATINTANVVRDGDEIVLDLNGYSGDPLVYFEDSSAGMGYVEKPITIVESGNTSELLVDINDWTDSVESLDNFIAFCAAQGLTVTSSNVTNDNTSTTGYTFPNVNHFKFWTIGDCYLEFTSPVTGTCELHYGNLTDLTQVYLNEVVIDSLTGDYVSKVVTFDVSSGDKIWLYENSVSVSYFFSIKFTYAELVSSNYDVTIVGSPLVFDLSGTPQREVLFSADSAYVFDQSDPTNDGYQIVFGTTPDASDNYVTGKTIMGTPGQVGAYTHLELPADFSGSLFYYHDTIPYMGYGPMTLSTDLSSAGYGDVVTFTVTNRTGVAETYTITGVASADINGADLSGSIGYGQQVDLSYVITSGGSDMVFSVGDLSANVSIANLTTYEFAVQYNAVGQPVFAVYDVSDAVYYNQTDLSFVAPNVYQFDLSSSLVDGGYTLVFGTEVDNSGTVVEGGYVTRETGKVILDLRDYTGDALVYFEDTSAGMGYVSLPFNITTPYTDINPPNTQRTYSGTNSGLDNSVLQDPDSLNVNQSWAVPFPMTFTAWVRIDVGSVSAIVGVIIQQRGGYPPNPTMDDVTQFVVKYSNNDSDYIDIDNGATFYTSYTNTLSHTYFTTPVTARYIQITPTGYDNTSYSWMSMQAGLIQGTYIIEYYVTVSGGVFDISGTPQLSVPFTAGEQYVFRQHDPTNAGQTLVFGRTPDATTLFTEGVTVMGEAGRDGAYTRIDLSDGFTGDLYYYSDASAGMGMDWIVNETYTVKVQTNALDQPVFAFDLCGNGTFYNQPDLSFNSGYAYKFDVSNPANNGYTMVFGTEVDVSSTIVSDTDKVIRSGTPGSSGAYVVLLLQDYTGDALVYFEDSSAGMGYVKYEASATESFGTLEGENANEHFGNQISLNADGTRIIVFSGSNKVKCFEYSNGSWTQLGSTITTSNSTVSMDAIGNSISIANISSTTTANSYVYDLDGTNEWQLRGGSSFVTGSNKGSNHASKLSGNGEYFWSTGSTNYGNGFAFQYYYDGSSWVTTRASAYGQFPRTYHIDTNYDGSVCVGTASNTDQFLVFPPTGTTIIQPTNISGNAISANLDGTRVAMVSGDGQYVRVYDKGADWSTWTLVGSAVSVTDMSTIALSDDGLRFVVGNPGYDLLNGTQDTGMIQVYELQNGVWTMLYEETGTATSDSVGRSVDISQFGAVIANGRYHADALTNLGSVDLFGINDPPISYDVTVSGDVFALSGTETLNVQFAAGTKYIFYQSDPTNAGQTLVFGRTPDATTLFTEGVTIMGTAGQQGAYTRIDLSDGFTGNLFYFSDASAGMGMDWNVNETYTVKVQTNALDQPVFAFDLCGNGTFYNQPDLSFNAPNVYQFDLSSSLVDGGYTLVFGTEVDNSGTVVETGYVTRQTGKVILNLQDYSGQALVYFEDTSAGMGYIDSPAAVSFTAVNLIDLPTEVTASGYSMTNTSDVNNDTKSAFFIDNRFITPSQSIVISSGYMVYMYWAYIHPNSGFETVNSMGVYSSNLGFSPVRQLSFHNGAINWFDSTPINNEYNWYNPKTYESVPEETWTHCAIVNEFSTGIFKAYINGVDKPVEHDQHNDNKNAFTVKLGTYGSQYKPNVLVSISDLHINNSASSFADAENMITGFLNPTVVYEVTVAGGVFDLSGTPQLEVPFTAGETYVFDQSDPTNAGQTLVFGRTPDATTLFTEGVTIMGSAGQQGAYTQIDLSAGFTGDLFYYSDASAGMGYSDASAGMGMVAIPLSIPNDDLYLNTFGTWINNTTDTPNFTRPIFTSSNPLYYNKVHLLGNTLFANPMTNENYVHDSYSGTSVTTTINNGNISGAWFQFQYPMALPIKRIQANASYPDYPAGQTKSLTNNGWPEYIVVAGSNDGTNWTYLDEVFIDPYMPLDQYGSRDFVYDGTMARGWEPKTVTNDGTWLYYRFIITRIYTGTNTTRNHVNRLAQFTVYTTD